MLAFLMLVVVTSWIAWGTAPVSIWVSALVLAAWIALLVVGLWRLLRPAPVGQRLVVWTVLLLLLLGMVLPPELLQTAQRWVAGWFGRLPGLEINDAASTWAHVGLYAAFAGSLLWARGDRHPGWFLLPLAGLAVATELMQLLVDGRQADPFDVVLNLAGIAGAAMVAWLVAWRHASRRSQRDRAKHHLFP